MALLSLAISSLQSIITGEPVFRGLLTYECAIACGMVLGEKIFLYMLFAFTDAEFLGSISVIGIGVSYCVALVLGAKFTIVAMIGVTLASLGGFLMTLQEFYQRFHPSEESESSSDDEKTESA